MTSKKTRRQRGGRQPDVDFVPGDETVGCSEADKQSKFSSIDFKGFLQSSPGCRSQLIKSAELVDVLVNSLIKFLPLIHCNR